MSTTTSSATGGASTTPAPAAAAPAASTSTPSSTDPSLANETALFQLQEEMKSCLNVLWECTSLAERDRTNQKIPNTTMLQMMNDNWQTQV